MSRTLPDTLRVEVRERAPLALAEVERLYLMDEDGVLIDMYGPRTAGFDLPIVRGLAQRGRGGAPRARAARGGAAAPTWATWRSEVSEVEVEASGDLRVVLRGDGEVLRLGAPPYRARLLTFLGLRKELTARCPDAEYFDLRFRDRIYAQAAAEPGRTRARSRPPRPWRRPPPVVPAAASAGAPAVAADRGRRR